MTKRKQDIPFWIYQRNEHLAKNYYACLKAGKKDPESARKAEAIQSALAALKDDDERDFVRENLFNHVAMKYINLPMSVSGMKRIKKRFICLLAARMGEA